MAQLEMLAMNRGDFYWVNFDPAIGSEIQKKRPAVIVSKKQCKVLADQITTVDKSRFGDFIRTLTEIELINVNKIIKQLDL